MAEPEMDIDEESIPRYQRGFEWFSHLAESRMDNRPWKRLGIFSFYDAPFAASDRLYLSPKQVMAVMAKQSKPQEAGLVFVADALERAEMGLSTKHGFDQFMEIFDGLFPDAVKLYFGAKDSERTYLHGFPSIRIPLGWLVKRPNVFAEVLSDASPIAEEVGPGDASFEDLDGMTEVLVEKLGPPSLTEEVLGKIKSTEASEYAGEAVGLMAAFVNPASAVSRGVRYLGKFVSLLKDRRKQEVKEVYQEWEERVRKTYSQVNLMKFFDPSPEHENLLENAVSEYNPVILVTETRGTLYDLFLPLVLQHLVEQIGYVPPHKRPRRKPRPQHDKPPDEPLDEDDDDDSLEYEDPTDKGLPPVTDKLIQSVLEKEIELDTDVELSEDEFEGKPETILFLDAATHLSKFRRSFKFALNIPEKYPNVSVAASFFTNREKISNTLQEGILEYMSDRALVFDFHPALFDIATMRMPISKKAWLQVRLQEMERIRSDGGVAFLEYYTSADEQWCLRVVEEPDRGAIERLRKWFSMR
ncbi:MAG: hypothetical protein JSW61_12280 [Candidatus Thorarchaeota archaeon]|nr:MAG: hypothetical protein JSW61_12280 [Candidatus Thorarchaeota archaeon]